MTITRERSFVKQSGIQFLMRFSKQVCCHSQCIFVHLWNLHFKDINFCCLWDQDHIYLAASEATIAMRAAFVAAHGHQDHQDRGY
jgi:hypothetical protein